MADNGTGTFVRLNNWVTDKTNSVPITASRMDAEMDGMATALSNRICKDGQTTVTANIPMNSHKFTGLSTGSARTDSITVGQVQDGQFTYLGTSGGSADAYTASPSPAITAYVATMQYSIKIAATNTTTTPYLQISAIGTPASDAVIKKLDASKAEIAVEASDMLANGIYKFQRNSANTAWILLNPEKAYQAYNTNLIKSTTSAYGISYLPSQITITNNVSDANNDIDFSAGVFQFSDGSGQAVASALTKRLDASWVAGTNQGGLDTGAKANSTWYHCYAIYNPSTLVSDFLFSTGATTPTSLPSGYTKYRRVGSIRTDSSGNIIGFIQVGNYFYRKEGSSMFSGNATTSAASVTLETPLGIVTTAILNGSMDSANDSTSYYLRIFDADATDAAVSSSNYSVRVQSGSGSAAIYPWSALVATNTSSQIKYRSSATRAIQIVLQGYIDNSLFL